VMRELGRGMQFFVRVLTRPGSCWSTKAVTVRCAIAEAESAQVPNIRSQTSYHHYLSSKRLLMAHAGGQTRQYNRERCFSSLMWSVSIGFFLGFAFGVGCALQ
jgi:hypothetical protein